MEKESTNDEQAIGAKAEVADSTLSSVVQVLTCALTLGTEGANGKLSASDPKAIAGEV